MRLQQNLRRKTGESAQVSVIEMNKKDFTTSSLENTFYSERNQ